MLQQQQPLISMPMRSIHAVVAHSPPRALVIEDNLADAAHVWSVLDNVGFEVCHAKDLLAGEKAALEWLDLQQIAIPTLFVLDLHMPHVSYPNLNGALLAASLLRRMHHGLIHYAPMIGLTAYLDEDREEEARFAGCHNVFEKPLKRTIAELLRQLTLDPPDPLYSEDSTALASARRSYQKRAEDLLEIVRQSVFAHTWTPDNVRVLLSTLTPYPAAEDDNPDCRRKVLQALGGRRAARETLRQCVAELYDPYSPLLAAFLDGYERKQIVKRLEGYSEKSVYRYIHELPDAICRWLQSHTTL
jgi:CheY-like chemotaxis protein